MADEQSIEAAMWLLVIVQTIGNVDMPGQGPRKMPSPRAYVPIVVGFSIVQLIADSGATKAAKAMAWLTVIAAAVLGPFGTKFTGFLTTVSQNFAISSNTTPTTTPSSSTSTGSTTP